MAGQGHQFPGNFQGNAGAMRTGFGGPMGGQMQSMPNQLTGKLILIKLIVFYEGHFAYYFIDLYI